MKLVDLCNAYLKSPLPPGEELDITAYYALPVFGDLPWLSPHLPVPSHWNKAELLVVTEFT